jgi:hypothetical protein
MMTDRKNFKLENFEVEGGLTIDDFDWIRYFSGIAAAVRGHFRPMMMVDTKKMLAVCKALAETGKEIKDYGRETVDVAVPKGTKSKKPGCKSYPVLGYDFGEHGGGDK